ncbi:MAG TPA: DNA internalization-related competence protein ComEC/Rec2 [Candidatus Acidoferrum sp.]|nr:DNA internalization-related competence protein ComEC/Rec2 [Candidatus Acidoferrum sp.]
MRLPAVAIAAAFASGIALGLHPMVLPHVTSVIFLSVCLLGALVLIVAGLALASMERLFPAATVSLLSWSLLGFLGACVAQQPRQENHVISLLEQKRLSLESPLRWQGRLRDEPAKLPWGYGLEIDLAGVEFEGAAIPVQGGLRVSFTPHPEQAPLPELHAGDEVSVLTEAKLPQMFRDEGAFDRRTYLAQQHIDLVATLRSPELIERVASSKQSLATLLARTRKRLRDEIDTLCSSSPQSASVLRAMLLGDRSFVDRAESADFQKTGAFHVLVVAGLHVGAIAAVLFWAGRKLRLTRSLTMLFTLALLFSYIAVVEERPPVLRAAVMTAIVVLGGFFFRRLELLNSAAIAALILLIAKPLALRDSSFQLTFVAIGCIAGLAVPWLEKTAQPYVRALRGWRDVTRDGTHEPRAAQFRIDLRSLERWVTARAPQALGKVSGFGLAGGLTLTFRVWELLVVTLALQIGMLPLMARDFHRVSLSAPLVNLAAVPMVGILVPLGFLTLTTGLGLPSIGKLLAAPLTWLTGLLVHVVQWFGHAPRWSYRIPGPPHWLIIFFFLTGAALAICIRFERERRKAFRWGVCFAWLVCAWAIAVFPFNPQWTKGKLELSVLDVGQGDSLFVVSPGGETILIDGGGAFGGYAGQEASFGLASFGIDPGEEAVSPYLWSRGFQNLDVVALTHAHQDHLGGLAAILDNFHVGKLWIGREVSSSALGRLEQLARNRSTAIEHELRGKSFNWDGVLGEFLWPETDSENVAAEAKNDDSLVLRLHYGNRTFLLPGDAEKQAELGILAENRAETLRSDVLKIGHHGGKNSTTQEFLRAVEPSIGIISVGEANPYGHPSTELLDRLEASGVRVLRTDRDGAVHVLTDGQQIEVSCFVVCPGVTTPASTQAKVPNQNQRGEKQ